MPRLRSHAVSLIAVAVVAAAGAGLGAYFGIRAAGTGASAAAGVTPPPRTDALIAFDADRNVVVMFGGIGGDSSNGELSDTWTWDGRSWLRHQPRTSPPAGAWRLMAYDAVDRDVLALIGDGEAAATWVWNGSDWTRSAASSPPVSALSRMATDPRSGRVLLVTAPFAPAKGVPCRLVVPPATGPLTGCGPTVAPLSTWTWTGTAWQRLGVGPAGEPSSFVPLSGALLVAEPASGVLDYVVLEQPVPYPCVAPAAAAAAVPPFTPLPRLTPPPASTPPPSVAPVAPMPVPCAAPRDGEPQVVSATRMSISRWNGDHWSAPQQLAAPGPAPMTGVVVPEPYGALAFIRSIDGRVWSWDGSRWIARAARAPSLGAGVAFAFDSTRGQLVLFGGTSMATIKQGAPLVSSETWTWSGGDSAWVPHGGRLTPLAGPSPRATQQAPSTP